MQGISRLRSLFFAGLVALPGWAGAVTPVVTPTVSYDFNGDGTSDVLWQNGPSGQVIVWQINAGLLNPAGGGSPGQPTADWYVFGSGDFNHDGKADILWRNYITGQVVIWFMNGGVQNGGGAVSAVPTPDWVIQGVGDFNGDGFADILWRNTISGQVAIWLMNGTTMIGNAVLPDAPSADWFIQGVGDFNHDGNADILWRNATNGELSIWFMNGTTPTYGVIAATPSSDWVIQGTGDFNDDGFADILWTNTTSGQVAIWFMNGTTVSPTSGVLASNPGIYWVIQGVGDYNGDGFSDILWRNSNTGQVSMWLMNGLTLLLNTTPATPTEDWTIIEPNNATCPDSWSCEALEEHNKVRAQGSFGPGNPVPSPPLTPLRWSLANQNLVKTWTATCPLDDPNTQTGPFAGYGSNWYGEFFPVEPQPPPPWGGRAVDDWAAEAANYTYLAGQAGTCSQGECGHYTQIVWRSTKTVGCSVNYCPGVSPPQFQQQFPNSYSLDCVYLPPGNFNGQAPY